MSGEERALLFIGHGTRLGEGLAMWHGFVDDVVRVAGLSPDRVGRAFVELVRPDVTEALIEWARAGVRHVHMVPLLLFSAGHMQVDLPDAVARAEQAVGPLDLTWSPPFGDEPGFVEVAADRAEELIAQAGEGVGVVLVGRGNRDEAAQGAFAAVAEAVGRRVRVPLVHGYLAGTGRPLESALDALWEQGCREVAVVPYLWFPGLLTKELPTRLAQWGQTRRAAFRVADPLGRDPRLVALVAARAREGLH
ncbi:sirohydrochlorin chelatase [Alicyclobacillus vulcanalis]|uniref:Sirohydrochlorin ferrochelatase n=1 Tax=Alicyclobacillus vulcanalis TaxID=252246 RepID=A0A1N7JXY2_9BACL|nr:sirohydrochlorin chelatase [Alicyclobacillus vulcanalis]SIS54096.1 Sirohydrochlorin ferrochelatase [Alicyclobacillus vulcanalis]